MTGSVLVFEDEVDRALNPGLLRATTPGPALPPAEIAARAREAFPDARIERIRLPADGADVYRVTLRDQARRRVGSPRTEASFDPATGALLGSRAPDRLGLAPENLLHTVYQLHNRLLLGNGGKTAVGWVGLALVGTVLVGAFNALRPARLATLAKALTIAFGRSRTRIHFDLHRAVGTALLPLLLAG